MSEKFSSKKNTQTKNEKIGNVSNAFETYHELTATGEPVYRSKRQQLK